MLKTKQKCPYTFHESAFVTIRQIYAQYVKDYEELIICLGWGAWEGEETGIMLGFYLSSDDGPMPPIYMFEDIPINYDFNEVAPNLPASGLIVIENGRFEIKDTNENDNDAYIEGFLTV